MRTPTRPAARRALAAAALAAAVAVAPGCRRSSETEAEADPVVPVKVVTVGRDDVAATVTAVGTVTPRAVAAVAPKIAAPIVEMAILKDRPVAAGEVIARLESRDLQSAAAEADAAVREAEATLSQTASGTNPESTAQKQKAVRDAEASVRAAEALVSRRETLYAKGGVPLKDLEDARTQLAQARAELDLTKREVELATTSLNPTSTRIAESRLAQARDRAASAHAQLDYAVVRSPIAGVVTEQKHQKGDYVAAGDALVTVADVSNVVVKAQFPDTAVAGVESGANARLKPSAGEEGPIAGTIRLVGRTEDPASRTVEVWVDVGNEANRLRAGEFVEVTITTDEAENAVAIPPSAVTLEDPESDEGKVVVVDETSVAHEVDVKVGVRGDDAWEITDGLSGGETVVVEGNYALPDGTKVRAVAAADESDVKKDEGGDESDADDAKPKGETPPPPPAPAAKGAP